MTPSEPVELGVGLAPAVPGPVDLLSGLVLTPAEALGFADPRRADSTFGESVAVSGDTVVVSAGGVLSDPDKVMGARSSVYVYTRQRDGRWLFTQRLIPPTDAPKETNVITRVALEGDVAAVITDSGRAFVYERTSADIWTLAQELLPDDGCEYFQDGLAVHGERIAVRGFRDITCYRRAVCPPNPVYLYRRGTDGIWQREARLVYGSENPSPAELRGFGVAVAMSEGRVAVMYSTSTVVAVFELSSEDVWAESARIVPSGQYEGFGVMDRNLARQDGVLVVSVSAEKGVARIYVFELQETGEWREVQSFTAPHGGTGRSDRFGGSLALAGT